MTDVGGLVSARINSSPPWPPRRNLLQLGVNRPPLHGIFGFRT